MNSTNSASFTVVSDSKMLDIRENTIPEKTLTERVSISRQNSNAKNIAKDTVHKKALKPFQHSVVISNACLRNFP